MSRIAQIQIFMLVLTLGFLTGPRVIHALQKLAPNGISGFPIAADAGSASTLANENVVGTNGTTSPYDNLGLAAKSIYVWDINAHRKLYGLNEKAQLPLASVTKMMMALVAVELLPADTKITIGPVDLDQEGDSGLYLGEKWALADLLKFTLVASSNDGASAIASVAGAALLHNASSTDPFTNKKLFIAQMNEKARVIGLTDTQFFDESGLDLDSVTSGAYSSSRDTAMLFEYIFKKHPELFTSTVYEKIDLKSESNIIHHVGNTNAGVAEVTGLIASKTGYTDLAGGNLVVVVDIGIDHPVVIAVLGSTRSGRFTDVEKLIDATVKEITDSSFQFSVISH